MKRLLPLFLLFLIPAIAQLSPEQKLLFQKAHAVLETHCNDCHGGEKIKGGLRTDSLQALIDGGDSGSAVVIGHAEKSMIIERMNLPTSDEDVMPPRKKTRPSKAELIALTEWVNAGAPWPGETGADTGMMAMDMMAMDMSMSMTDVEEMHANMGVDLNNVSPEDAAFFKDKIEPLLITHCVGCHGPQKEKGGLRLDLRQLALKGGDSGNTIVPGKPEISELLVRMALPLSDDDVMPPEEKQRLPESAMADFTEWINRGAPWPKLKSKLDRGGENHYSKYFSGLDPKATETLEFLRKQGVFLEPLIWKDGGVRLVLAFTQKLDRNLFKQLEPFEKDIKWLDLSRQTLTEDAEQFVSRLTHLSVLHLERSSLDDASFARIGTLPALEYLNVHSTKITDASIGQIKASTYLTKLYLWQSGITDAGAEQIKQALPDARVVR